MTQAATSQPPRRHSGGRAAGADASGAPRAATAASTRSRLAVRAASSLSTASAST